MTIASPLDPEWRLAGRCPGRKIDGMTKPWRRRMGTGCVGPVGDQPAGTVYEIPTGKRYGCLHERGSLLPDGTLLVNGTSCTPF